jgi:predicted metal-dependent phosphoesterase TrpH
LRGASARGLFHVHTTHSFDGKSSVGELAGFCRENRFAFVCVTEHADGMDEDSVRRAVEDCDAHSGDGVRIVPGFEYAFPEEEGVHLLCVGLREALREKRIGRAVDEVRRRGGLAIVAHPSRNRYRIPEEIVPAIDGIEVWNAAYDSRYLPATGSLALWKRVRAKNPRAMAYAGLDMHDHRWFRELFLELGGEVPARESDLIDDLRQGRFRGVGRYVSVGAVDPPPTGKVLAWRAGRFLLGKADRLRSAWKRDGAGRRVGAQG